MPPDPSPGGIRISPHLNFIISFPVNTSPLLPGPVSSEEPTPSEPLKGTPYHKRYFFIRHQACRPVHGSEISPSPRGSRRAASRRKYHCQNSSDHGRSRCKRYCTLKDFPLGHKRHRVPVQAHGICLDFPSRFFILMKIRTQLLHSLTVCYSAVKVRGRVKKPSINILWKKLMK